MSWKQNCLLSLSPIEYGEKAPENCVVLHVPVLLLACERAAAETVLLLRYAWLAVRCESQGWRLLALPMLLPMLLRLRCVDRSVFRPGWAA